jgi:hypothetical protein
MITVVPGITGLIDRLEAAGLVCRKRCENDRRVVYVCIAEKATGLLAEIDQPLVELHKELLGHLAAGELVGVAPGRLRRQPDPLQELLHPRRAPLPGHDPVGCQRLGQELAHPEPRGEGGCRIFWPFMALA